MLSSVMEFWNNGSKGKGFKISDEIVSPADAFQRNRLLLLCIRMLMLTSQTTQIFLQSTKNIQSKFGEGVLSFSCKCCCSASIDYLLARDCEESWEFLEHVEIEPFLKIFTQIFSFIKVQLFNSLLLRRECCSFSNGEYVKAGLAELENWCYNATDEYAGSAWDELKHIRQAIGFLDDVPARYRCILPCCSSGVICSSEKWLFHCNNRRNRRRWIRASMSVTRLSR